MIGLASTTTNYRYSSMSSIFERHPKKTLLLVILVLLWGLDFALAHIFPRPDSDVRIPNKIYHHDLLPDVHAKLKWGDSSYSVATNSLGFKDAVVKNIQPVSSSYRVLFIGDSFTEGIGYPFEQTFVGLIARKLQGQAEVLNAGVSSYSPKLYFLKVKDLLENEKLQFDELAVFIDISDIQDEITYSGFNDKVYFGDKIEKALLDNSMIARLLERREVIHKARTILGLDFVLPNSIDSTTFRQNYFLERGRWTYDPVVYKRWGATGVDLALKNMDELYDLLAARNIKLTIAVYPWPEQILKRDLDSIQVGIWQKFCHDRHVPFLNYFPVFVQSKIEASKMISDYFIKGDVHWNDKSHAVVANQWIKFRCGQNYLEGSKCFQH